MKKAKKIFGLIGRAVDYSYSPLIHNTAFDILGLPCTYTIFNIATPELIRDALFGARALGIGGFSVTIPYKKTVVPFLDELSAEAASIKAVNTIVIEKGRLIGHNTDITGFAAPLQQYGDIISGRKVAIFGCGGAALAAIEAFTRFFRPQEILLFVRDPLKARELLEETGQAGSAPLTIALQNEPERVRECTVIVNATPIGTKGRDDGGTRSVIPLEGKLILPGQIVYDMVYNPYSTPLLKAAECSGAISIPGIEMLLGQAARAFRLWTGMQMPVDAVRKALKGEIQPAA
ncbi:MAG: shikimate dehydrogenase [Chlorobiaceae bacterium]